MQITSVRLENRMVTDSVWHDIEKYTDDEIRERLKGPGYKEIGSDLFVSEENAYDYALERISYDEELKQEFLEWFYSGNWIKEG